jgi:ABC-2 type transport system permease protein
LNIDSHNARISRSGSCRALVWKAWRESRNRYFASLASLLILVGYAVLNGPQFLEGIAINHPDEPLTYSGYVWVSLFNFYLQGFWIACAFVLGLGGIWRERSTGLATFTLSLPVTRKRLVLTRAAVALVEAFVIALVPCLLIPLFSAMNGYRYPLLQSLTFGLLLAVGGLVFVCFSFLLSSLFGGEYTAFVLGICANGIIFFAFKARSIHRWSIFDLMSGARHIDPSTYLLKSLPWGGLSISLLLSFLLLSASIQITRSRNF